jgi:uncharacterized protein
VNLNEILSDNVSPEHENEPMPGTVEKLDSGSPGVRDCQVPDFNGKPALADALQAASKGSQASKASQRHTSGNSKPLPKKFRRPSTKTQAHKWSRIVHVYTSMISLVLVAFFSLTGITLNHPDWTIGSPSRQVVKGTLPKTWKPGAAVDWLATAESLRAKHSLRGSVDNHTESETSDSISFKAPGYAADAFIDPTDGSYELTIDQPGLLATLNDLHKGRDANSNWKWLIDTIGVLLVVISMTGLLLQLFLRKRRSSALASAAVGTALSLAFAYLTLR